MRIFFRLVPLVLALSASASFAAFAPPVPELVHPLPEPTLTARQADIFVADLAAGMREHPGLVELPMLKNETIAHVIVMTGIHPIVPNDEEDYFVLSAMVGKVRYHFSFTTSPKLSATEMPHDLDALLRNRIVTQYAVSVQKDGIQGAWRYVGCRSREHNVPACRAK